MSNRPLALVTGASAGIGAAIARELARAGYDLVLTARRQALLDALAAELRDTVTVHTVTADLARKKGVTGLLKWLDKHQHNVNVLINNAGMVHHGWFADISKRHARSLVQLNVGAVTALCQAFVPRFVKAGSGHIVNVASVAAFQAVPGMSLYSASKAFVLSFSEGLAEELRGSGVHVTAVCPGLTRTALAESVTIQGQPVPEWLMDSAESVAKETLCAIRRKAVVSVPGAGNQLMIGIAETQPRWFKRVFSGIAARAVFGDSLKTLQGES